MRMRQWFGMAVGIVVVVALLGNAAPAKPVPPYGDEPKGDDPKGVKQLSAEEQTVLAEEYRDKIISTFLRVQKLAEAAQQEKDIVKLNCLNNKLLQIKGLTNVADSALQELASLSGDRRSLVFSKLTITYQKVIVAGQEAEGCAGEELAYVEKTEVEVTVDQELENRDPTLREFWWDFILDWFPLPVSSAYD